MARWASSCRSQAPTAYVDNEGVLRDEMTALVEIAGRLARELTNDLDSVSLPEVKP